MKHHVRQHNQRRGSVSVFILVVIVLMSGILLARARHTVAQHRQTRNEQQHLQTRFLADAGIQIARDAWRSSPTTFQLDWIIPSGAIHQTNSGLVTIRTTATGECTVVAEYPVSADFPSRISRTEKLSP